MEKAKSEFSWFCPEDADEALDTLDNLRYVICFLHEGLEKEKAGDQLILTEEGLSGLCLTFGFIEETMAKSIKLIEGGLK